jgi:hypothetical protein
VYFGSAAFSYPEIEFNSPISDTAFNVQLSEEASYVNVPIGISFKTEMDDGWWLEVIPALELSWLQRYQSNEKVNENEQTIDRLPVARDFHTWVSFQLGATYKPFDTWGYSIRFQGRYQLNSLIENSLYLRETLYNIGVNAGIQYRF